MEKQVVLLTGATGGLGKELSKALKTKYRLALHHFNGEKTETESDDLVYFSADLRNETEIYSLVEHVISRFGRIDVLINNAGVSRTAMSWKMNVNDWRETMAINLDAPFILCKEIIPFMRKQGNGSIINMSSIVAQSGQIGTASYAASKAGLLGLTKTLAKELAHFQINVNALALGYFDRGMISDVPEPQLQQILASIPMKKLGSAETIVKTLELLISDEGKYITGQTLNLNGGLYC